MIDLGDIRIKFSYKRTEILNNVFTVCELEDSDRNLVARGISICSILDQHIKKKSRCIALGRAIKAFENQKNSCEIIPNRFNDPLYEKIMVLDPQKISFATQEALDNGFIMCEVKKNEKVGVKVIIPRSYPIQVASQYFQYKCEYMPSPVNIFD
jgi:hypothetical protein